MVRNVDLIGYLPPFMAEYKEISAVMNAENPELQKLIDESELLLDNQFIYSADENGIALFEKLLGLPINTALSLEERRFNVLTKWTDKLPYTVRTLKNQFAVLCGEKGFTVQVDYENYLLRVDILVEKKSSFDAVKSHLNKVVPANMVFEIAFKMPVDGTAKIYAAAKVTQIKNITVEVVAYGME